MKIIVTGGAGFIGSNFVRMALTDKFPEFSVEQLTVLDLLTYAGDEENLKPIASDKRYKFVKGDIRDLELAKKLMLDADQVVHFAAESHVDRSIEGGSEFVSTNVMGTQVLLDAAKSKNIKRFVHVSTEEFDALRIRSGWPVMGREIIAGETLPAALGVVSLAVSFTKGCYPGQELVERMDSRGSTAPKNLRLLTGSIVENAKSGDAVIVNGETVGEFTSVAPDCALAYVGRAVELGAVVGAATIL